VATLVAGCAGVHPTDVPAPPGVDFSKDAGRITGFVLDDSFAPIQGIDVTISDSGRSNRTDASGAFDFPHVPPSSHHLVAQQDGYQAINVAVVVEAGASVRANLVLMRLPSKLAHYETRPFVFLYCDVSAIFVAFICNEAGQPYHANLTFPAHWAQTLTEMAWKPAEIQSHSEMGLSLEYSETTPAATIIHTYNRTEGRSPLRIDLLPEHKYLPGNSLFQAPKTPKDGEPGPLWVSIDKPNMLIGPLSTVAIVYGQRVNVMHTVFYYKPAKDIAGFHALPDD
jgi:hypothetical protein